MDKKQNIIIKIDKNSIAEELGIEKGDILVSINDKTINDVFDYRYQIQEEYIELLVVKPSLNNEEWLLQIEKDEMEDLGIAFEEGLMDDAKSCKNKCIFCFIDQLPPNMRETLYFKDDDSRLSFLQGNYITLTNMSDEDLERIIFYHLSPINISVHTTDLELRKFMLKNPNSDKLLHYIQKIADAGIEMNFQIVLLKDINDGEQLNKTIEDLSKFIPKAKSLSVVPVGITKFRDKLFSLKYFTKQDAVAIIETIDHWQNKLKQTVGTSFVFAADEFYFLAEKAMPNHKYYEDFPQIENGVGLVSLLSYEFQKALKKSIYKGKTKKISIVTGTLAFSFINSLALQINEKFPNIKIDTHPIKNNFFGDTITVSGLLTGSDIISQLKNKDLGDCVLIPINALKDSETIFLDDIYIADIEKTLRTKVIPVGKSGHEFLSAVLKA